MPGDDNNKKENKSGDGGLEVLGLLLPSTQREDLARPEGNGKAYEDLLQLNFN